MNTVGNLRFNTTTLIFYDDYINMMGYLHKGASTYTLLSVAISYLICQSGVTGWVCHMVRTVFSAVEHLTLEHDSDGDSNWSYIVDRILWHEIGSVKTFRVGG